MIRAHDGNCLTQQKDLSQLHIFRRLLGTEAFARLNDSDKKFLSQAHWNVRLAEKGTTLIDQGHDHSSVVVLMSGWAFCYQTVADGRRQILDFVLPDALLGFCPGERNWYGVETVTNCSVATLPVSSFYRLLGQCPALALGIATCIAASEMRAHEHMTNLGRRNARERVAALIVELANRTQRTRRLNSENSLELPLTQVMIGDALGLSNEHVCRTLAKLAEDGIVAFNRHSLKVLDPRGLADEAGVSLEMLPKPCAYPTLAAA